MPEMKLLMKIWILLLVLVLVLVLVPTAYGAVDYDNITVAHDIRLCKPVVTSDYFSYYAEHGYEDSVCNVDTFVLSDYPENNLPSGGRSSVLSASEMVFIAVNMNPGFWEEIPVRITFYRDDDSVMCPACDQHRHVDWWDHWTYTVVGRFDWEIASAGHY